MVYRVDINSNNYFSTNNTTTTSNRTYGVDWSFLNREKKKYKVSYNFSSEHSGVNPGLNFQIYSGYFNNSFSFFDTQTPITTGITFNLSSIATATNNLFPSGDNNSLRINSYFRAKRTGTYRFFTRSKDASYIVINGSILVDNGGTHTVQDRFANINMVAGTYYSFILLAGISTAPAELSLGWTEPNDDGTNSNSTNVNDFIKNATGRSTFYRSNSDTTTSISGLLGLNLGTSSTNRIVSNKSEKRQTFLAGILKVKRKCLYSKPSHQGHIFLADIPTNNFITIELLDFDGKTPINTDTPYLMTLYFEEIED